MRAVPILFLVSFVATVALADPNDPASRLAKVVETERSFARLGAEVGVRDSFLRYFADDVALFPDDGAITYGKEGLRKRPTSSRLLKWAPAVADVSLDGSMGWTCGPWEFWPNGEGEKPVAIGNFVTVWKRQGDGSYLAALDLGVDGSAPIVVAGGLDPKPEAGRPKGGAGLAVDELREAEAALARVASQSGLAATVDRFFAPDAIVLRARTDPAIGAKAVRSALEPLGIGWSWKVERAEAAGSGDLGYALGTARAPSSPGSLNFVRIWKRDPSGAWRVVLDIAVPGAVAS